MPSARFRMLAVLLAVAALLGSACVDDGEVGGPSIGGSAAASVGPSSLTHAELADLVDRWATNPEFMSTATTITDVGSPGRRPAAFVGFVLNFWLQAEQGRLSAAPPTADVTQTIADLTQQFPAFADYDEEFQATVAEAFNYQGALASAISQGVAVQPPPVEVSSRYGSVSDLGNGVLAVSPPSGSVSESGDPFGG